MKKYISIIFVFILLFTSMFSGCNEPTTSVDEGTTKCVDGDLYTYVENQWVLTEQNCSECDNETIEPNDEEENETNEDDEVEPIDSDGDSIDNSHDAFPYDNTEWKDSDGDGVGDNEDDCPLDKFKTSPGVCGCGNNDTDSDGDGVADCNDLFPNDGSEWQDSDKDGVGDNSDAFPNDSTQWADIDKDGFGDNPNGNNPDLFVNTISVNLGFELSTDSIYLDNVFTVSIFADPESSQNLGTFKISIGYDDNKLDYIQHNPTGEWVTWWYAGNSSSPGKIIYVQSMDTDGQYQKDVLFEVEFQALHIGDAKLTFDYIEVTNDSGLDITSGISYENKIITINQ